MWKSTVKRDLDFYGKINIFIKKLLKSWFRKIFWAWHAFSTLWLKNFTENWFDEKSLISLKKKYSSNQLSCNFFSKQTNQPLLSRIFCQKSVRVNFRKFHNHCGNYGNLFPYWKNISSNNLFSYFFNKNCHFDEIFASNMRMNSRNIRTLQCAVCTMT